MVKESAKRPAQSVAYLYERLSRDDNLDGESYSIQNQKLLLEKAAKEKGYTRVAHFNDDGISGVTMERPGLRLMLDELEKGKAKAVFVKDLSRLGRNYIEVGRLLEEFFPRHDIRFVSVSDNIDTAESEDELAPIRNLFNEWYARDLSKKKRISNQVRGNAGVPLGPPPYGYIKDPEDPHHWIVDGDAAQVVRRIYQMSFDGMGVEQIAAQLSREEVLNSAAYCQSKNIGRSAKHSKFGDTHWCADAVRKILINQAYCGDVVNFKTYSKSYKDKKRRENPPENWKVFQDVHEPVIDRAFWEQVQKKRQGVRKRTKKDGERNMFSGLLVCADCGTNLHFHFNQGNHDIQYFNCASYNGRHTCPSTHYIRVDFLERVLFAEIKRLTQFAGRHEEEFLRLVLDYSRQNTQARCGSLQQELAGLRAKDREMDGLFEQIYKDNLSGKLSDDRFGRMSVWFDDKQKTLRLKMRELQEAINDTKSKSVTAEMFAATVHKYSRAKKLSPRMLNELVERIEVHQSEKIEGIWRQRLTIHYTCVGVIHIPDNLAPPLPDITLNTRKGVFVSYLPND